MASRRYHFYIEGCSARNLVMLMLFMDPSVQLLLFMAPNINIVQVLTVGTVLGP